MKPFTYVVPHSLAEAAEAAAQPDTIVKGAGIDLVDRMKERLVTPAQIVNLLPLAKDLAGVSVAGNGEVTIGAATTLTQLEQNAALANPALAGLRTAAAVTATPQVRTRGTVAGNILQFTRCWYVRSEAHKCLHGGRGPTCLAMTGDNRYHAVLGWQDCVRVHPSNLAPPLLALGAEFTTVLGDKQQRRPLAELFPKDPRAGVPEHTLQPGEIVIAVHVPPQPQGTRSSYAESRERESSDWATTACAARVVLDGGVITAADLVLGAVSPIPRPRPDAAKALLGKQPDDGLFRKVADLAYQGAAPLSHNAYKLTVGKATVREALHLATQA
ncbi:MAG: FAD binding domain-containing protein [Planctomycetes bacterium]|nr:FAD binding domain-containing protein [Planctomycetota bacterium]MCB9886844.1 FAD binding domain-containing protein [Planctomycetota bacterium]